MGEFLKEPTDWPEETWLNLLQHSTQSEIDTFLALLEQNGLKIIETDKYNLIMSLVDQSIESIERLESCIKAQTDEIAALELRVKTLMRP